MIKILEKNYLNDKFIDNNFTDNISIDDKLIFNKNDIYYFGNYDEKYINLIKEKLIKNKKNIIKAINNNIKIIIAGNTKEIFNNQFKMKNLNLYTCLNCSLINKIKKQNKIKKIKDIKIPFQELNFRYKNLICIDNEKDIFNIIKKAN